MNAPDWSGAFFFSRSPKKIFEAHESVFLRMDLLQKSLFRAIMRALVMRGVSSPRCCHVTTAMQ